jgi:outer membrane lipoprotein SlyB
MKKIHVVMSSLIALLVLQPLTIPASLAQAQAPASRAAAARIDGFDVEPVKQLSAGNELRFTLYGTPGGNATVRIGNATGSLILEEVDAGVYEGGYTINRRDKITKLSTATANLRVGNSVASSVLDESLAAGAAARWPGGSTTANGAPKIDQFDVDPPARLSTGSELLFTLRGTPGGSASVRINGVRGKVNLEELESGRYEGAYLVRARDSIAPATVVTGNLRVGKLERSRVLGQSLVEGNAPRPRVARAAPAIVQSQAPAAPVCANCGTVQAINVVEHKGDGSYLGMIGGGVVGAVIGSQVGSGTGRTIASVVGAAGGAYAGNEIEKRMKTTKHFEVVVRLDGGATQTLSYPAQPSVAVGSRVRVESGGLVAI